MTEVSKLLEQYADEWEFLADRYFWDPLAFVLECIDFGPDPDAGPDTWQEETLTTIKDEQSLENALQIAIASGHGIGKSSLIAWLILWFISTRPEPQIVVTANTLEQLSKKTWRELAKWHKKYLFQHLFRWTATKFYAIDHAETWFASAVPWSEHNAEAFAGTHEKYVLLLFDEASNIADKIWETAQGAMTTPGAMWIVFGNPTRNQGRFRECFRRFRHRWITRQIDSRTAKMTNKELLDEWVQDYGEDSDVVRVRVRGVFPRADDAQFISDELMSEGFARDMHPTGYLHAPSILSMDPAREGSDLCVISYRQGLKLFWQRKYSGLKDDVKADIMASLINELHPDAVFIDMGGGTGTIDLLVRWGHEVTGVNFGGESGNKKRYANKGAEMMSKAKAWLEAGGCLPDDDNRQRLTDDLTGRLAGYNDKTQLALEKKAAFKTRMGYSPDFGDSFMLTFAFPVAKKEAEAYGHQHRDQGRFTTASDNARQEYNPINIIGGGL